MMDRKLSRRTNVRRTDEVENNKLDVEGVWMVMSKIEMNFFFVVGMELHGGHLSLVFNIMWVMLKVWSSEMIFDKGMAGMY